jgi:hypothetical protein
MIAGTITVPDVPTIAVLAEKIVLRVKIRSLFLRNLMK